MSTILKNNSETVAHTPGRASSIGVWILQVVLAAIIAGGGISKLAGDPAAQALTNLSNGDVR